jgi:arsenate reductase
MRRATIEVEDAAPEPTAEQRCMLSADAYGFRAYPSPPHERTMSKVRVYHYPQCSTCKKALKWLSAHDAAVELIDIVKHPPSKRELREALLGSGLPLKKLFNTSGLSYREGKFGERLATMSEAEALDALAADGKLIKRPLLLGKGFALVGFDEAAYRSKLG